MFQGSRIFSLLAVGAAALLLGGALPARADLTEVNIFDNTVYEQTTSAAPTSPSYFFFNAAGNFQSSGDFTGAQLTDPNSNVTNLPLTGPTSFGFGSMIYNNLSDLHGAYPFGTYTITGTGGNDGPQSETFSYPFDAFTADIPALNGTSFTALQGLDPSTALTIGFNAYTPDSNTNQAFTFFSIANTLTGATVFDEGGGFLPNTTTSAFLAANTLAPNTEYTFQLDFSDRIRTLDANTGITVDEGFDVRTFGDFTTGSTSSVPEPGSLVLFGTAAIGALAVLRRRSLKRPS